MQLKSQEGRQAIKFKLGAVSVYQSTKVVLKRSLNSQHSSHVPCVEGGKNFKIGRQKASYVRQKCWYLGRYSLKACSTPLVAAVSFLVVSMTIMTIRGAIKSNTGVQPKHETSRLPHCSYSIRKLPGAKNRVGNDLMVLPKFVSTDLSSCLENRRPRPHNELSSRGRTLIS